MKTKLYTLALLAVLACGLCLAVPPVRLAAAELLATVFNSPTLDMQLLNRAQQATADGQPALLSARNAEDQTELSLLYKSSTSVRLKSVPGVSLTLTPLPGCAGDLTSGLTTSDSQLTCGVQIDWSVDPSIIAQHPLLGVRLLRYADGPATIKRIKLLSVKESAGRLVEQLSPLGSSSTANGYGYVIQVGNGGLPNRLAHAGVQVFEHADSLFFNEPGANSQCFNGVMEPATTPMQIMPIWNWQFTIDGNNNAPQTPRTGEFMHWETKREYGSNVIKVRGTWYGFTRAPMPGLPVGSPVWLQTLWKTPSDRSFIASLRMYRFNPDVGIRTAGERVGTVKAKFFFPAPNLPFQNTRDPYASIIPETPQSKATLDLGEHSGVKDYAKAIEIQFAPNPFRPALGARN